MGCPVAQCQIDRGSGEQQSILDCRHTKGTPWVGVNKCQHQHCSNYAEKKNFREYVPRKISSAESGHALLRLRNAGTLKIIPKAITHMISIGPRVKIEG
jgi:hypothetical protein